MHQSVVIIAQFSRSLDFAPLLLSIGVLWFFNLKQELGPWVLMLFCSCFIALSFLFYLNRNYFLQIILTVLVGFLSANISTSFYNTSFIESELNNAIVKGYVGDIVKTESGTRVLLYKAKINGEPFGSNIRLTLRFNQQLNIGDYVKLRANLIRPMKASVPYGFDFEFYAFFNEIGAIGYQTSRVYINTSARFTFNNIISRLRNFIKQQFVVADPSVTAIIQGMLLGDISAIQIEDYDAIKKAGLAHIISISGMHIVVVVGILFFISKYMFARSSYICLHFDVKKLSALIALFGCFLYLQISGSPVSAKRAFLMSGFILCGIIMSREITPLRSISIAAICIIILLPHSLIFAGTQMSFAACYALIATYQGMNLSFDITKHIKLNIFINYVVRLTVSSIVAGAATSPFVLYHFYQFTTYSVLSNLFAVPLADFIIMPLLIAALLLLFLGLHKLPLYIVSFPIKLLVKIAYAFSALPYSTIDLPLLLPKGLLIFSIILFIICTTVNRYTFIIGLLCIVITIWKLNYPRPILALDKSFSFFMIKDQDGRTFISSKKRKRFLQKLFGCYISNQEVLKLKESEGCNKNYCNIVECDTYIDMHAKSIRFKGNELPPGKDIFMFKDSNGCSFMALPVETSRKWSNAYVR